MTTIYRMVLLLMLFLLSGCAGHRVIYLRNERTGLLYGPMETREPYFGRGIFYTIVPAECVSASCIRQKQWLAQEPEDWLRFKGTTKEALQVIRRMLTDKDGVEIMRVDIEQLPAESLNERSTVCFKGRDLAQVIYVLAESLFLECRFTDGVVYLSDMRLAAGGKADTNKAIEGDKE